MAYTQSERVSVVMVHHEEPELLMECAYLCLDLGWFDAARDIFTGVTRLLPNSEVPLNGLGQLFYQKKQLDVALQYHQQAAKRKPNDAYTQVLIGKTLLGQGQIRRGRRIIQQVLTPAYITNEPVRHLAKRLLSIFSDTYTASEA